MKRFIIAFCLLITAMTVHARAIREEVEFSGEKARASYALGMTAGQDLLETGLELDYAAFTEGLRSAMEQRPLLMDRDEALEIVQNAFERAMNRKAEELRFMEELFLAENATRPAVSVTDSGLQYEVLEEGDGANPVLSDIVLVNYEGLFVDGTVFDSSYERGSPEEIPLEMVIPGWAEGIQLMSVGSKYLLYIPSNLAYGERGAGQIIPPYSTLIFTVELLDIIETEEEETE